MIDQTLIFLLGIPLAGLVAIIAGGPARSIALLAAIGNFGLALVASIIWGQTRDPQLAAFSLPVLEKPAISLSLGLADGMTVVMLLLSTLVTIAAVLAGKCPAGRERLWFSSILLISLGAVGAFLSTDLFFFYAFHELALIPTFLMIGLLGKGDRKAAAWKITIYLAFGSIILLAGLLWLVAATNAQSFLFSDILAGSIEPQDQIGIAALLLVGFGVLVSLFPFHSWAAPAYASAPTPVSMLHAGVLKKFGLYGLLRLYPLVSEGMQHWLVALIVLLLGNILWVGFITINQKRLDNMLANSSVMHMGYVFLAIAALIAAGSTEANAIALPAAVILMFGHGVSIALLFALSDRIESKTGSLRMEELGGLAKSAPVLAFLFGLAGMASIGLPGLANFAGEAAVFLSGFRNWTPGEPLGAVQIGTIIAIFGVVISAIYMLRAIRNIFHGPESKLTTSRSDLSREEQIPALLLAVALLVIGLYPNLFFNLFNTPVEASKPAVTASVNQ
ncbi:complex I subunit 4 family protein [Roseibacillus ishigakijimensis]|uniref:NADH-quinone oxidoreductase subunit M n=1 Tax=Roseibacillus ishigakijimensis TaxID=454146 RepID=A0A934VGX6_9BACT|nr:NADH-quinone oxidoreductase subunit M [Roseibacillus ishigakijimensis]MBK1833343.1 NADH-quinone oxidoreductase subunit M [Roseibacillus ishigakijimensis]